MIPHHNEIEKADLLGERLVGGATEIARVITEQLGDIKFRDPSASKQFVIEVIVFYMHLVDRLAFAHLGAASREIFGNGFIVAVVKQVLRELSKDISADDFCQALRDTYNHRGSQYCRYKEVISPKNEPLKGTLYWEFSKILFEYLDDHNPATLVLINLWVADLTKVMVTEAMQVEEILASI